MRGLAACLVGLVGLGALATMAACSDSSDGSAGGMGGAAAVAGSGGKASTAGSSSVAGTGGGGAEICGFYTQECSECLGEKCADETAACTGSCGDSLLDAADCMCDPANDTTKCIGDFVTKEGDVAEKLANCYSVNCETACK